MKPILCLSAVFFVFSAALALAGEPSAAPNRLEAIAPFLEDQTIVAAHVDLSRIDVAASLQQAANILGLPDERRAEMAKAQPLIVGLIAALKSAGTTDLYAAASVQEFLQGAQQGAPPYVLAPVKEGGDHRAVAAILFSGNPQGPTSSEQAVKGQRRGPLGFALCERVGDVVFCGSKETLERLKGSKAAARPELASALAAVGDTTAQVVFAPTADHRRVLAEMLPKLPEELGGGSGQGLADGLLWAALGVQGPPQLSAQLIVQSKDPESAAQFERFLLAAGRLANEKIPERDKPPQFGKLLELFTPKTQGNRLTVTLNEENQGVAKLTSLLTTVVGKARQPAQRNQCADHLKQLALAMHSFHDVYGGFPPSASYDSKGAKLLSWRVYLLPFLEQQALYEQFHLNEPWDSEHNKTLIPKMPPVFACSSEKKLGQGMATYLAPLGEKTLFAGKEGVPMKDVTDGMSNTIMFVEVDPEHAVIWTKPDDLQINFDNPLKGLLSNHEGGFQTAFCDGSVRFIAKTIDPKTLGLLLMRNDGKPVGEF